MTLTRKEEKGYLKVEPCGSRPGIAGRSEHVAELAPLFEQRGIPCWRVPTPQADQEVLLFEPDADVAALQEILEAHQGARGS
jgi:hypothetical protein